MFEFASQWQLGNENIAFNCNDQSYVRDNGIVFSSCTNHDLSEAFCPRSKLEIEVSRRLCYCEVSLYDEYSSCSHARQLQSFQPKACHELRRYPHCGTNQAFA